MEEGGKKKAKKTKKMKRKRDSDWERREEDTEKEEPVGREKRKTVVSKINDTGKKGDKVKDGEIR